jgi:hypothetical protein
MVAVGPREDQNAKFHTSKDSIRYFSGIALR